MCEPITQPDDAERFRQLLETIALDPPAVRRALGIQTEEDREQEALRAEALETWRLSVIRNARLQREQGNAK